MAGVSVYARNAVTCKLSGLVASPVELILGVAIFEALKKLYGWPCWIYSEWEFKNFVAAQQRDNQRNTFAIVPAFGVAGVGYVDFAIFARQISVDAPLVIVEADGHRFHQLTPEQASEDKRRDRALQKIGVPFLRYTGTDVVRDSDSYAREIAAFVRKKICEESGATGCGLKPPGTRSDLGNDLA
jgi:hypothetical protein